MSRKEEMEDDIVQFRQLDAVANSKGGKVIIKSCKKDIVNAIDALAYRYKELSHIEMIAFCADLKAKLDVYRIFKKAKSNREEIEDLLEEESTS